MTWKHVLALIAALLPLQVTAVAHAAVQGDDPGPTVRYGGTPIELHFDARSANVTKAFIDGTPCIIVSAGARTHDNDGFLQLEPEIALSCDWSPR